MNLEAFDRFAEAYRAALRAAAEAKPDDYALNSRNDETPWEYAAIVADKMLAHIQANPGGVSYGGDGFKRACKALGIKHTRKAIWEYLGAVP